MLKSLKAIVTALALGLVSLPAGAVVFNFSNEFSGSGATCANGSCATLAVTANATGGVNFLLTGTMIGSEFISELSGNQSPFDLVLGDFSGFTGTGADAVEAVHVGQDSFKADGDGFFDWMVELSTNPPRFDGTDTLSWTIANTSLSSIIDAVSVGGSPGKNGFTFAIHAQGLANGGGSGWFSTGGGGGEQEVSEPSMLALFGLGLLMMGFLRRRTAIA